MPDDNQGSIASHTERLTSIPTGLPWIEMLAQAWADGEILVNYRCTPGVAVDRYRPGGDVEVVLSRHL